MKVRDILALARSKTPVEKAQQRLLGDVGETLTAICRHGPSRIQLQA